MLADARLSNTEGWLLIVMMVLMMTYILRDQQQDPTLQQETGEAPAPELPSTRAWLTFGAGLLLLIASSHLLVWGAIRSAELLGVPELLIGLTVIAVGTSLPELAATITCALRGHTEIAIGNVIGSNLFNLLVVMAIPGIVSSQTLAPQVLARDYTAMAFLTGVLAAVIYLGRWGKAAPAGHAYLGRLVGVLLVTMYALYYHRLYLSL